MTSRTGKKRASSVKRSHSSKEVFTAKDFLFTLDAFFAAQRVSNEEKRKVWDILTALRGPDGSNHYLLKWATTAVIRAHVFVRGREVVRRWAPLKWA